VGLGLWQGNYQGTEGLWLRWYDHTGWIPTPIERANAESQRADTESQRADTESQRANTESQRAEKLAAYLRSQGIDPDNLPILGTTL
jgi:hypothetical protein